jgi:hypothetical protein
MTAHRFSARRLALGTLWVALAPSVLFAQAGSYHSAFGYGGSRTGNVLYCGSFSTTFEEGFQRMACAERGVSFFGESSNIVGKVSGKAELTFMNAGLPLEHQFLASSVDAQWTDRLFVGTTGVIPSFVQMRMLFEGGMLSEAFGNIGGNSRASAGWWFGAADASGAQLAGYSSGRTIEAGSGFPSRSATIVDDFQTFTVPVSASGWVDFGYRLRLDAQWFNLSGDQSLPTADVRLNFSNSAKLIGLDFFTADMQAISNVQYTFQNGTQIFAPGGPGAPTPVPEPTACLLLSSGMLLLLVRGSRRAARN